MPPARHRNITPTSLADPFHWLFFPDRSWHSVDGHLVSAPAWISFRFQATVVTTASHRRAIRFPCSAWHRVPNRASLRLTSSSREAPVLLVAGDYSSCHAGQAGFLPPFSRPYPTAFFRARLKPPPVRSSRKLVPPEGLPQFSACPVACARSAGSAPDYGGFSALCHQAAMVAVGNSREGEHHV